MFVMGGSGLPFGHSSGQELYIYNLRNNTWYHIGCTGRKPRPLYGHVSALSLVMGFRKNSSLFGGFLMFPQTAVLQDQYLYRFGGTTGWEYNAEVHRLDLRTKEWQLVSEEGKHSPSERLSK